MKKIFAAAALMPMVVCLARSQPAPVSPEFDAVSIRPSAPDVRGGGFNLSPGRLQGKNVSLRDLVSFAYDLHDYQLSGGEGWTGSEYYNVVATFPAATTESQRARMMQATLVERFALEVHREPKDLPGYALVVTRSGPKLHAGESGVGGLTLGRNAMGLRTLNGTMAKMPDLALILADLLHRPVQDATGLSGIFDFSMEWSPDPVMEGLMPKKGGDNPESTPGSQTGPSIFTALQEQLGLRLETRKVPVQVLVIDHAGKPTAN